MVVSLRLTEAEVTSAFAGTAVSNVLASIATDKPTPKTLENLLFIIRPFKRFLLNLSLFPMDQAIYSHRNECHSPGKQGVYA